MDITWVYNHAKFEGNLLHTSAVINKTIFEQRGMIHQEYQLSGPSQSCQDTLAIGTHYIKTCKLLLVASKDMIHFSYISAYVGCKKVVCLSDPQ